MVVVGSPVNAVPVGLAFSAESRLLEMVASGYPLSTVTEVLCRWVEPAIDSASHCAVSLIDWRGLKFQDVVAPSLPLSFHEAMRGQPVVCETGPCARAACLKSQVIAADMESDPLWQFSGFRFMALAHGQRSCWSTPILSGNGSVLGTFAVLHDKPGKPSSSQYEVIGRACYIAGIVIERAQHDALMARHEGFHVLTQGLGAIGSFAWPFAGDEISCSEQLYRILALDSRVPMTASLILSRVHPDDLPALRVRLARGRTECNDLSHEFRLLIPNHAVSYVRMAARANRDALGRWEYLGAIQDVTEYRLCEQALREAKAELAYAARVMSLGALSASIAHEIKQPLSGIITNASTCLRMLAADPPDLAGARETAKRTLRDGNRASDIITRLRALFTKKTVSGETLDLNALAQEALTLSFGDLQRRRVTVVTEFADEVPPVQGDRIQLHQVILNLLLNAADAMAAVDDRARQLRICTELDSAGCVVLSVQDSGTGIGAHAARIFEPFYTTKNDGMGIGLSISHDIIVSHGGRLWATQNEGPGATFCFSIPRAQRKRWSASPVSAGRRGPGARVSAMLEVLRTARLGS
jgi:signal transduction histidine kinase